MREPLKDLLDVAACFLPDRGVPFWHVGAGEDQTKYSQLTQAVLMLPSHLDWDRSSKELRDIASFLMSNERAAFDASILRKELIEGEVKWVG